MKKLSLLVAAFALLGNGCVKDLAKTAQAAGVKSATVEPRTDVKNPMRYGFKLDGQLGSWLIDKAGKSEITQINELMERDKINVPDMVRESFIRQLKETKAVEVVDGNADATFLVTIEQYGFDPTSITFRRIRPFIVLTVNLQDNTGKSVWRSNANLSGLSKSLEKRTWDDYLQHPEYLKTDWTHEVDEAVKRLLRR